MCIRGLEMNLTKIILFLFRAYGCFASVYVCATHFCSSCGSQKRAVEPMKLELQTGCEVVLGTWVLWQGSGLLFTAEPSGWNTLIVVRLFHRLGPGLNEKENISWPQAFVAVCFLFTVHCDQCLPGAPASVTRPQMGCLLELESRTNPFSSRLSLPYYFISATRKETWVY